MVDQDRKQGDGLRADRATERLDFEPVPKRRKKKGGMLRIAVFSLVLAGVGAGGWAFLAGPLKPDLESSRLPVVRAEHIPFKQRPDNPGGMAIPDRDKLVYGRLPGAEAQPDAEVERLLPPAEQPTAPPAADQAGVAQPVLEVVPPEDPTQPMQLKPRALPEVDPPAPVAPQEPAAQTATAQTAPPPQPPTAPQDSFAEKVDGALKDEAPAPPPAETVARAAPPAPPPAPPEKLAPAKPQIVAGDYMIQLAAVRSPERAELEWERLSKAHQDLLGKTPHTVVRADLGEKGVFYRLRVGPMAAESAARELCAKLAERKVGCLIVRADG